MGSDDSVSDDVGAGGASGGQGDADDEAGSEAHRVGVLACAVCHQPLARSENVMRERAATWDAAVYADPPLFVCIHAFAS